MELVHLRASQIDGQPLRLQRGDQRQEGGGERRAALRRRRMARTDFFSEDERAALALAESMTRMADRTERSPTRCGTRPARHFGEKQLAGLVLWVATTNLFNRLNAATKQPAGAAW